MLEFIQLLNQRYRAVLQQSGNESVKAVYRQRVDQLIMGEACIRKGQLIGTPQQLPLQIAVVGPTQSGKSTLVNVLLNSDVAGVSPLAGYTVHPQGFCHGIKVNECSGLQRYFGRFQQLHPSQLSKERHDCYSLVETLADSKLIPRSVIWDTPDFDSIDSATYREGVFRAVALADIIVLVVSKEKYADQSVWDMMSSVESLHQPTLICLNKLNEGSESLIIHSLKDKWRLARNDEFPEVVSLYYRKETGLPEWPESARDQLMKLAGKVNPKKHVRSEQDLLQQYWPQWLEPVIEEHHALGAWQELLDQSIKQGLEIYQRDFLNHPHHYETFQCAMAELLTLLEIPGVAKVLANTRKVLTWPVKQIMKMGRKARNISDTSQEIALLNQIAEHLLIQMADRLREKTEEGKQSVWWKELGAILRSRRQEILQDFDQAVRRYHLSFQQDVEGAAHRLYYKLQEQPVVLNSLRATRVTTDAAVIALALHTGGIGIHDLVVAPSMLTVTSLLTESAIGSYMHRIEAELKQHQLLKVRQDLFISTLRNKITFLPSQLSIANHFNITPEQLQKAENHLKEKRHGLRLL
ncbi:MAG: GTPase [Gammaproteobacteria bacterium]